VTKMIWVRILSLIAVAAFAVPPSYGKNAPPLPPETVCAAFSATGVSSAVTLKGKGVSLEITSRAGQSTTLTALLPSDADECHVFFDRKSHLVVVSAAKQLDSKEALMVFVADAQTPKWVSNFTLEPYANLQAPLSLVGFLGDSESLVVEGSGTKVGNLSTTTFVSSILLDIYGRIISSTPFERILPGRVRSFADSTNNRLWYLSSPDFCPIRSTTLTGEKSLGPEIDRVSGEQVNCLPDIIAFPDSRTTIMAATLSDRDTVWRVDLETATGEKISVPSGHFPKGDQIDGNAALSPDGQILAFSRHQFSYGLFDNFRYKGSDIVVVQVRPLHILGVIRPKGVVYRDGFAVDHRGGDTTVFLFSEGAWKRIPVEASKLGE
jgi:hypothetical protein